MKKFLSIVLTLTMMFTMALGTNAFADQVWGDAVVATALTSDNSTTVTAATNGSWSIDLGVFIKQQGKASDAGDTNTTTTVDGKITASNGVDLNGKITWSVADYIHEDIVHVSGIALYTQDYTVTFTANVDETNISHGSDTLTIHVINPDTTKPVITLLGTSIVTVDQGSTYTDAGATASDNQDGDITSKIVTVNPVNTAVLASYTVTYNVSDAARNQATQVTRTVNVVPVVVTDTTPPTFTYVPSAKSEEATGITTVVDIGMATATDASGCTVTNNAPSAFPYGQTTVTWTATDAHGLTSTATQVITIVDTTAPVIIVPDGFSKEATDVNTPVTAAELGTATGLDIFIPVTITNDAPSTFPMGTTTVTWKATDAHGLTSIASQMITIVDTTAPVFTELPLAKTVEATAVDTPKADIDFGTITATDIFSVILTNDAPDTFPMGTTKVTWTATDANGLTSTADQVITIVDTTHPVFTVLPLDKTVEATAVNTPKEDIDFGTVTATDIFSVTLTSNAPSTFPMGTTTVTWTAADGNGLTSTASQVITIVDTTLPVFTFVPPTISIKATAVNTPVTAAQIGTAIATDIFGVTMTNNAPSTFPIGKTTITWIATDGNGLKSRATQDVIVTYNFTGFLQPIDNPDPAGIKKIVNTVKAGSAVPIKFNLGGNMGLDILAIGYPKALASAYVVGASYDDIETIVTSGSSGLSYDPITMQYTYVWKTDKSWGGASKQLVVILKDGSVHTADFLFK